MAVVLLASNTAFNFATSRETTAEVLGFTLLLGLSTLPGMAARSTHQRRRIFWLNLLLGWTILGWLGAFLWAILSPPVQAGKAT
jgi:hypothetical protein